MLRTPLALLAVLALVGAGCAASAPTEQPTPAPEVTAVQQQETAVEVAPTPAPQPAPAPIPTPKPKPVASIPANGCAATPTMACLSEAAETCAKASIIAPSGFDLFGLQIRTTARTELLGTKDGLCQLRTETLTAKMTLDEAQITADLTAEEKAEIMAELKRNADAMVGYGQLCSAPSEVVAAVLRRWADGKFSSNDLKGYACDIFGDEAFNALPPPSWLNE